MVADGRGRRGECVWVCTRVCVSSVYAEQKVGQRLIACVLLLLCCVFRRNSMFYSEAAAAMSPKSSYE